MPASRKTGSYEVTAVAGERVRAFIPADQLSESSRVGAQAFAIAQGLAD